MISLSHWGMFDFEKFWDYQWNGSCFQKLSFGS